MKKVLSLVLAVIIAVSSVGGTCFAKEPDYNASQVSSEMIKNEDNDDIKTVEYALIPLLLNLSKLIATDTLKFAYNVIKGIITTIYNTFCGGTTIVSKAAIGVIKVLARLPRSVGELFTGYQSEQIKALEEELKALEEELKGSAELKARYTKQKIEMYELRKESAKVYDENMGCNDKLNIYEKNLEEQLENNEKLKNALNKLSQETIILRNQNKECNKEIKFLQKKCNA